MADLRKTPAFQHQLSVGQGNYNRFNVLSDRPRTYSSGKRSLETNPEPEPVSKQPRMDANKVFDQLKVQDKILEDAKEALLKATKATEDTFSAEDGGMGTAISNINKVLTLLLQSQTNLTSAIVDICQVTARPNPGNNNYAAKAGGQGPKQGKPPQPEISPEEAQARKVKQALRDAEKKTLLFNLNLGDVPTMNKDNLSSKVTLALCKTAKETDHGLSPKAVDETLDDVLSCSRLEFLGSGSRTFYNRNNDKDPRNGKMCTVPVRLDFKTKENRIQAEANLRKICKVSCSVPYPKRLRTIMNQIVADGKKEHEKKFIRIRVDIDNLTVEGHARYENEWVDLGRKQAIPLDILDKYIPANSGAHGMEVSENSEIS
jgi:hypothetical protein